MTENKKDYDKLFEATDTLKEKLGRLPTCKELDEFMTSDNSQIIKKVK